MNLNPIETKLADECHDVAQMMFEVYRSLMTGKLRDWAQTDEGTLAAGGQYERLAGRLTMAMNQIVFDCGRLYGEEIDAADKGDTLAHALSDDMVRRLNGPPASAGSQIPNLPYFTRDGGTQ